MKKASLAILAAGLALSGCALEKAGSQGSGLDTSLPPPRLVARGNGYELAEPQFSQCTYRGDEKPYAHGLGK